MEFMIGCRDIEVKGGPDMKRELRSGKAFVVCMHLIRLISFNGCIGMGARPTAPSTML